MNKHALQLENAAVRLESIPAIPPSIVVGFDGFVDEMISLVGERKSLGQFEPVASSRLLIGLFTRI
jgi:hypothetical protein